MLSASGESVPRLPRGQPHQQQQQQSEEVPLLLAANYYCASSCSSLYYCYNNNHNDHSNSTTITSTSDTATATTTTAAAAYHHRYQQRRLLRTQPQHSFCFHHHEYCADCRHLDVQMLLCLLPLPLFVLLWAFTNIMGHCLLQELFCRVPLVVSRQNIASGWCRVFSMICGARRTRDTC